LLYGEVRHGAPSYTGAMRPEELEALLVDMRAGRIDVDEAVRALRRLPVEDLGFAQLDTHRELRQGMPEAIYAEGKSVEQLVAIAARMIETTTAPVLATRTPPAAAAALLGSFPDAVHHGSARLVVLRAEEKKDLGRVVVASAGTSDLPVADEAAHVADALGCDVERLIDAGVAGVHRIIALQDRLAAADVVIVVAGMEGALPSIVGGLTPAPVIAVPTSVGYGSSFEGLTALLGMLNSCAAGITVVNIDNGFGAAMAALRLLRARR
jgi:pyridinium-3,5-biscarboxylic acid mononucleotide synthase